MPFDLKIAIYASAFLNRSSNYMRVFGGNVCVCVCVCICKIFRMNLAFNYIRLDIIINCLLLLLRLLLYEITVRM